MFEGSFYSWMWRVTHTSHQLIAIRYRGCMKGSMHVILKNTVALDVGEGVHLNGAEIFPYHRTLHSRKTDHQIGPISSCWITHFRTVCSKGALWKWSGAFVIFQGGGLTRPLKPILLAICEHFSTSSEWRFMSSWHKHWYSCSIFVVIFLRERPLKFWCFIAVIWAITRYLTLQSRPMCLQASHRRWPSKHWIDVNFTEVAVAIKINQANCSAPAVLERPN